MKRFPSDDINDLVTQFTDESLEQLDDAENLILRAQNDTETSDSLDEIKRFLHSIKGHSAMMGFKKIQKISHVLEDFIVSVCDQGLKVNTTVVDLFSEATDVLKHILRNIQTGNGEVAEEATYYETISHLRYFIRHHNSEENS
jgi:two-component system chemotaxis sensor kinase CheA